MIVEINNVFVNTETDKLLQSTELGDYKIDAYCCVDHQICYIRKYKKDEIGFIQEYSKDKMNDFLEFVGSPSRIFTDKKEMKRYVAKCKREEKKFKKKLKS